MRTISGSVVPGTEFPSYCGLEVTRSSPEKKSKYSSNSFKQGKMHVDHALIEPCVVLWIDEIMK
jgi:hypothetical protein